MLGTSVSSIERILLSSSVRKLSKIVVKRSVVVVIFSVVVVKIGLTSIVDSVFARVVSKTKSNPSVVARISPTVVATLSSVVIAIILSGWVVIIDSKSNKSSGWVVFWVRESVVAVSVVASSSIDPVVDNNARISSVVAASFTLPAVVTS